MKKCPECGNPSYDGAPVCGNCGYNFPKPKSSVPRNEDIFQQEPKEEKTSNEDTISIIRENKFTIGTILLITIVVICGIVVIGYNDSNSSINGDFTKYSANGISFDYPNAWKTLNLSDVDHINAKFYQNENNVTIEFYNVTSDLTSLKEITQDIISYAQDTGAYVELVDTTTINNLNFSDIIIENADGNYTRYMSMFNKGELYVFKMDGKNANLLESEDINATLNSINVV